jgi:tetratricopeptide (TPR) repeat protein
MKLTALLAIAVFATQAFSATPAENAIRQATANIEKQPEHFPYYNELAMAYARRARETADAQFYAKAEQTLHKSFELAPGNFDGLKVQTWIDLGRHEFAKALETATRLNKTSPDDLAVYGYLVDANVELGNYGEAVEAAQWMLDLRSGNVAGLTRAAYLRELYGNLSGALEMMQSAYDSTAPSETEDRAWILAEISHLELLSGNLTQAETAANSALRTFPDYHEAIKALAQVRIAQSRYSDAEVLLAKQYAAAPHTEDLYALAEAQELAGHTQEAAESFKNFEVQARGEAARPQNANRQLIAYYVDHSKEPARALELAAREVETRHDVFTLDSYAWALAATGDYDAANQEIAKAIAMGWKDPKMLFHAGAIALHLQQPEKAASYLKEAQRGYSREATALLAGLPK